MIPTYKTLAEKDPIFNCKTLNDMASVLAELFKLESEGYFFRGQADASWKLFSAIQRKWLDENLQSKFNSIHSFIKQHIDYQKANAADKFSGQHLNDISVLSTLQHFGGPTPFIDFTSKSDSALYFATDNAPALGADEATEYISIYAWKPGKGAASASTNDLTNWVTVVEQYEDGINISIGGIKEATSLEFLKAFSVLYLKPESEEFLKIANPRLDLQNGLFLFAPKALNNIEPYEALFDGITLDEVVDVYEGLFIPKLICLNIPKSLIPEILKRLTGQGITGDSLGLDTSDWAWDVYQSFRNDIEKEGTKR